MHLYLTPLVYSVAQIWRSTRWLSHELIQIYHSSCKKTCFKKAGLITWPLHIGFFLFFMVSTGWSTTTFWSLCWDHTLEWSNRSFDLFTLDCSLSGFNRMEHHHIVEFVLESIRWNGRIDHLTSSHWIVLPFLLLTGWSTPRLIFFVRQHALDRPVKTPDLYSLDFFSGWNTTTF